MRNVAGCSFAGRIVDVGAEGPTYLSGRPVALRGYAPYFMPPLNADGFASEYATSPPELLTEVGEELVSKGLAVFLADACIAFEAYTVIREHGGNVLVYGAGTTSALLAKVLSEKGYSVDVISRLEPARRIIEEYIGVRVYDKPPSRQYDTYVMLSLNTDYAPKLGGTLEDSVLVILHPHLVELGFAKKYVDLKGVSRATLYIPYGMKANIGKCIALLETARDILKKYTEFVDGLTVPPTLMPPGGIVLRL
jgi:hypothetical protein